MAFNILMCFGVFLSISSIWKCSGEAFGAAVCSFWFVFFFRMPEIMPVTLEYFCDLFVFGAV